MRKAILGALIIGSYAIASAQELYNGHYKIRYVKTFSYSGTVSNPTGETGIIKGKVIYIGNKKLKNKRKLITKDKEVCGKGYKIDQVYVISSKGEVKNAVIFIKDVSFKKEKEKKILTQKACEFNPRVIPISAGSKLQIVNEDPVKHEATGVQDFETIFKFAQPKKGLKDEVVLKKPGVVEITCSIHGWMKAWAVVTPNPYYAVSKEDGTFEIRNVPVGKYTLKLWHEGFGEMEKKVEIKPGKVANVVFELR